MYTTITKYLDPMNSLQTTGVGGEREKSIFTQVS